MGFLDHLFKPKQSDEKMAEGGKGAAGAAGGNGENAGASPDPGAFLHPKDFRTRGSGSLPPPVRPAAPGARIVEKSPPCPQQIVLTLGDVLSLIPTPLLQPGFHDANRELRFSIDDLSADIARGRAAVPLSKIAALCPDVFAREIAPGDDTEIRLPLQKLVEQIGLLRGRPAMPPAEPADLPVPAPSVHEEVFPAPPEVIAEPAAATPVESHASNPTPDSAPPDAPTTGHDAPQPAFHLHPPPPVRPVLLPPPTLLAALDYPAAPLVETAPAPDHPPHFPQEALQTLLMTDESPDLAAVCRRAAALPGVRACALDWRGEKALAGEMPEGFDPAALHEIARLHGAPSSAIGALESITLHGDQAAISIFTRPGVLLAVLHGALPPGVRERLAALTAERARP